MSTPPQRPGEPEPPPDHHDSPDPEDRVALGGDVVDGGDVDGASDVDVDVDDVDDVDAVPDGAVAASAVDGLGAGGMFAAIAAVLVMVVLLAFGLSRCGSDSSDVAGRDTAPSSESDSANAGSGASGSATESAAAVRAAMDAPLMPDSGLLIGGYISAQTSHVDANRRQDVIDYESAIERPLDIAHDFYPPHQEWLVDRHNWHIDSGRIPMITWRVGDNADAFLRGDFDEEVRVRARQAKEIKGLFFSRFFHEMDGQYRLDWDMDGDDGAAKYVEIWKRARRIFDQEGVTNAVWVWSPATFRRDISPARYYPGDDQVDWIAVDPYLWVPCKVQDYADMTTQVSQAFFDFAAEHPTKPVMLGEWGTPLVPDTTWRADFLASTFEMVDNHPEIVAIVYFDSPTNLPCDWRLMDDPETLQQYRDFIGDPKYAVDLDAMDLLGPLE